MESPRKIDYRFLPGKLFSESTRGRKVELLASALGWKVQRGYHHVYRGGALACQAKPDLGGTPNQTPSQDCPEKWDVSPWFYHADNLVNAVDDCTHEWFRVFLRHGTVWTGACINTVHQDQRLAVKPLESERWPSDPLGPSWPSFPSITEWMEMLRRGLDPFRSEEVIPPGHAGFTRVSRGELHDNHVLATRIVSNNIVGIRSTIKVPRKFLKYFRYRQNFLILTVRHNLPIGLVRFLLGRWIKAPYSLWLRRAVLLKSYLRNVPISLVKASKARLVEYSSELYPASAGSCTPPADSDSESYSEASSEPFWRSSF